MSNATGSTTPASLIDESITLPSAISKLAEPLYVPLLSSFETDIVYVVVVSGVSSVPPSSFTFAKLAKIVISFVIIDVDATSTPPLIHLLNTYPSFVGSS